MIIGSKKRATYLIDEINNHKEYGFIVRKIIDPDMNRNPTEVEELSVGDPKEIVPVIIMGSPISITDGGKHNENIQSGDADAAGGVAFGDDHEGDALTCEGSDSDGFLCDTFDCPVEECGAGDYDYTLTCTDQYGATASDDVTVTVAPEPNENPTADAGEDASHEIEHDGGDYHMASAFCLKVSWNSTPDCTKQS